MLRQNRTMQSIPRLSIRWRLLAAPWLAAAALLAGCGGGGGDSSPSAPAFASSQSLANMCTVDDQKKFVRSYLDEVYLWYDEIPAVDAAAYSTIPSYFEALRARSPDATGQPKDRFSAALPISVADAQMSSGSGASQQPVQADGNLLSLALPNPSVPLAKVVTTPGGRKTGYILFLDHDEGAQDALIPAFQRMRDEQVADLVLDLRYNSGGYLYIALAAASMVAGPQSEGQVFEQLRYNRKRTAETANSFVLFSSSLQFGEKAYPRGTPLPQLGLPRLYVLTTGLTCSSSESIVNSLRGIDVEVILVGQTTCGKPYGFQRKDNCGYALFPIEFQGFNAKGFGDYTAGFKPTCTVAEVPGSAPGSETEPLLAAAMTHIDTGNCPAGTATAGLLKSAQPNAAPLVPSRPAWGGRLLRTER
jgi:hypothetical protein